MAVNRDETLQRIDKIRSLFMDDPDDGQNAKKIAEFNAQERYFKEMFSRSEVAHSEAVSQFISFLRQKREAQRLARAGAREWDKEKWDMSWAYEDLLTMIISWWDVDAKVEGIVESLRNDEIIYASDDQKN